MRFILYVYGLFLEHHSFTERLQCPSPPRPLVNLQWGQIFNWTFDYYKSMRYSEGFNLFRPIRISWNSDKQYFLWCTNTNICSQSVYALQSTLCFTKKKEWSFVLFDATNSVIGTQCFITVSACQYWRNVWFNIFVIVTSKIVPHLCNKVFLFIIVYMYVCSYVWSCYSNLN